MTYPKAANDAERIEALHSLGILDSARDENFDRVVRLCKSIFGVEIVTISLVDEDRQWFKSVEGLDICETDRDLAFCNYTITGEGIFEVPDAYEHPQLSTNGLVTGAPFIRYYAGAPIGFDGHKLGALCLIDTVPHMPLDDRERRILSDLAEIVEREIRVQRLLRQSMALLTTVIKAD